MLRFPWSRTEEALNAISDRSTKPRPQSIMMFVNPESGAESARNDVLFGAHAAAGEGGLSSRAAPRAPYSRYWKERERASSTSRSFSWSAHDTIACPTFAKVTHRNTSTKKSAFLVQVDDGPLQSKLGFYEENGCKPSRAYKGATNDREEAHRNEGIHVSNRGNARITCEARCRKPLILISRCESSATLRREAPPMSRCV